MNPTPAEFNGVIEVSESQYKFLKAEFKGRIAYKVDNGRYLIKLMTLGGETEREVRKYLELSSQELKT